jgi:hypothetical protein
MRFWPWLVLMTLAGIVPQAEPAVPANSRSLPRIQLNDNHRAAGRLVGGVLKLSLVADTRVWYPTVDNEPGIPIQAFRQAAGALPIPGPLIRVPAGTVINGRSLARLSMKESRGEPLRPTPTLSS